MSKTYPIWVVLAVAVVVLGIFAAGGTLEAYVHIPSLLLVVLISFFLSLSNHGIRGIGESFRVAFYHSSKDRAKLEGALLFFKALQRYFLISGLIGTLVGGMAILLNLEDVSSIGPNVSTALMTILYGLLLYIFICVPFITGLRKQLLQTNS